MEVKNDNDDDVIHGSYYISVIFSSLKIHPKSLKSYLKVTIIHLHINEKTKNDMSANHS